ncbi:MAG: phosphatidate cytidylyltransferase [Planctomycetota bacterium]
MLFALISFYCLREFLSITPTQPGDQRAIVAAFYLVIPWQYYLVASHWYGLFTILIPVWAFLVLPVLSVLLGETRDFLQRTAPHQWA